jgi:hypothetical protein
MAVSCKHSNKPSGSIICSKLLLLLLCCCCGVGILEYKYLISVLSLVICWDTLQNNDNMKTAEISKFKSLTVNFLCSATRV